MLTTVALGHPAELHIAKLLAANRAVVTDSSLADIGHPCHKYSSTAFQNTVVGHRISHATQPLIQRRHGLLVCSQLLYRVFQFAIERPQELSSVCCKAGNRNSCKKLEIRPEMIQIPQ